ncbi:YceD family protein [Caldalkalibacillus salinus]|uniref:YceD family protein n=1 Tax=Caldalkalibacillus salinus TaxID=2803787 RepID=UPI001922E8FF|nr:YceD family protein [Caldalkalibacillus salinus]
MKIPVRQCLETKTEPMTLEHHYDLPDLVHRHQQLEALSPVHFKGEGEMQAGLFVVKGELKGQYTLTCSRCLSANESDFTQPFEERYNIEAHVTDDEKDELEDIHDVEGQYVDLQPQIEEEIIMSIPFIPVCESEEACKNNALREGQNWSYEDDRLTEEDKKDKIDPRLADLAKFFDEDK